MPVNAVLYNHEDSQQHEVHFNNYVGPPFFIVGPKCTQGRVACYLVVSLGEYADGTDRRTGGRTPYRYMTLSAVNQINHFISGYMAHK